MLLLARVCIRTSTSCYSIYSTSSYSILCRSLLVSMHNSHSRVSSLDTMHTVVYLLASKSNLASMFPEYIQTHHVRTAKLVSSSEYTDKNIT